MQTFLPSSNFLESAKLLDKKRCWKQVVEAKQIIGCLTDKNSKSHHYFNHPAVQMWVGYVDLLKHYYNLFLLHCKETHKINTKLPYLVCTFSTPAPYDYTHLEVNNYVYAANIYPFPFWLNNQNFHRSHRSRLIEKDKEFYLPKFPTDEGFNDSKYLWPVMQNKTFKII
jgi:hypothetical protein